MRKSDDEHSFELETSIDFIEEFEGGMGNLENGIEMKFLFSTENYC
jgi:hypothetical protein